MRQTTLTKVFHPVACARFIKTPWRLVGLALLSLSLTSHADTVRQQPLVAEHLQLTQDTLSERVINQLLQGLNQYRSELREGLQMAKRPISQQSTEQQLLLDILRSASYFDAEVDVQPYVSGEPLRYNIRPGTPFRIRTLSWDWPETLPQPLPSESLLSVGDLLDAATVLRTQAQLRRDIQQRACYRNVNVRYELELDRSAQAGDLRFYLEESPEVSLGEIIIEGAETIRISHIERLTQLQPGDCFQRPKLDQARLNLYESDLFARVDEQISEPNEQQQVTVVFTVRERFHRTVQLGGGYDTDFGVGISAQWLHRNFDRRGERLLLGTDLNFQQQTVEASYTIPRRQPDWPTFIFSTQLQRGQFSNQDALVWQKRVGLEQRLSPIWTLSPGLEVRSSWLWEDAQRDRFEQFLSLPTALVRETRNEVLNPSSGSRFITSFQPTYSLSGEQPNFGAFRLGWQSYWGVTEAQVVAFSADFSTLFGLGDTLDLDDLSVTERLFAGGGGSVRGWDFQGVSPSSGGRTRILQSLEHRMQWSRRWGTVAFVDAAWLSSSEQPEWSDPSLGAGFGVRYFTDFAPLRVDFASPLPNWGERWRFYLSIGQSF